MSTKSETDTGIADILAAELREVTIKAMLDLQTEQAADGLYLRPHVRARRLLALSMLVAASTALRMGKAADAAMLSAEARELNETWRSNGPKA